VVYDKVLPAKQGMAAATAGAAFRGPAAQRFDCEYQADDGAAAASGVERRRAGAA